MKKTLTAVAVLGAFAGSALAADVQLYGIVDTGVRYLHSDLDIGNSATNYDATDRFSMESGMQSGSRFGFKGTEEIGNGLTVGFVLESQFSSDTGALHADGFFRREASLFLQGNFGKFAMGRIGSMNGGVSSWAKHGVMSAFGTSWGSYAANADNTFGNSGIWNNSIAYETPDFAGFKVFAQYGMGNLITDNNSVENESTSDRYYAIGASYANGPLSLYLSVDSINYASTGPAVDYGNDVEDAWTVRFGGNYDFEVVQIFAGAAYFDEARLSSFSGAATDLFDWYVDGDSDAFTVKGWSLGVSAAIPAAGGKVLLGASYMDAEAADSVSRYPNSGLENTDVSRWIVSAGYDYPLSKRTNVYGVVTYNQDSVEYNNNFKDEDPSVFGLMVGLRHRF